MLKCSLQFHDRKRVSAVAFVAGPPAPHARAHARAEPRAEAFLERARAVAVEEVQRRGPRHLRVGHALRKRVAKGQERTVQKKSEGEKRPKEKERKSEDERTN